MKIILGWENLALEILCQLEEINIKLERMETKMAKTQADLDALVVTLQGTATDLINLVNDSITEQAAAFKRLEDKITAGATPADLQAEVDNLSALNSALQASMVSAQAALTAAQNEGK